jgi:death-on-curing family protein
MSESRKIEYPHPEILERWVIYLRGEGKNLKLSLPRIDAGWYKHAEDLFSRLAHPYSADVHRKAAELFYNANKAHNVVDGNKRTSIILVYLFYVVNGYLIQPDLDIKSWAKRIAKSKGRKSHDRWLGKLEEAFSTHTKPFL